MFEKSPRVKVYFLQIKALVSTICKDLVILACCDWLIVSYLEKDAEGNAFKYYYGFSTLLASPASSYLLLWQLQRKNKERKVGREDFLRQLKRFGKHVDVAGKYLITSEFVFTGFSYM